MTNTTNTTTHPRARLIQTAADLVHKQGWTATGINQILLEAGIPKGSFYYYFRSKEALGVAVLEHHFTATKDMLGRTLLNLTLTPDLAIAELLNELRATHAKSDFKLGCPVGSFANEVATQSPSLLAEANRTLQLYQESWASLILRGQKSGMIPGTFDATEVAKIATNILQGAFLDMKCTVSVSALELAIAAIHNMIFNTVATHRPRVAEMPRIQALAS